MSEWISVKENLPQHMQIVKVFYENPFFGSAERKQPAVFLRFTGSEAGSFWDAEEQIHLDYITKWKPFSTSFRDSEKLQTLSAQISWSHNVAILSKCKDPLEKEFYMKMSKRNGWTYRVLIHHIELGTYENTLLSQSNFKKNLPTNLHPEAFLTVKDDYGLDFLGLGDEHSEQELERAIVKNIEAFLREVGTSIAFLGSQYRIELEGQEFFIDLLFYHRRLKSLPREKQVEEHV